MKATKQITIILISLVLVLIVPIIIGLFFLFFKDYNKIESLESNIAKKEPFDLAPDIETTGNKSIENKDRILPEIIKVVYLTSWSASKESHLEYIIDLARTTEINAVVIDIKDFSGYVAYDIDLEEVKKYNARQIRISDIDSLIKRFHQEGIYLIARISVFQDPVLARARPDLAVHSKLKLESGQNLSSASLWLDKMGLAWIDPAAQEAWRYNILIAKDAANRGFDELNFDYIRFPSDGDLQDMVFTFWDEKLVPRHSVIKNFFEELDNNLPEIKISIDLFGLSTSGFNDLGVGQIIEDAYAHFDYVCPMIYPSHYAQGFQGYQNPADYPYEVVNYSMRNALLRLEIYNQKKETVLQRRKPQIRPWLQDFDLGAIYDEEMVRAEIRAVYDTAKENFKGFMLWNSYNFYTKEALESWSDF